MEGHPFSNGYYVSLNQVGIELISSDEKAQEHIAYQRIQCGYLLFNFILVSSALSENTAVSEVILLIETDVQEVASLQTDLIKFNRVFYKRAHNVKKLSQKLASVVLILDSYLQLKRNIDELNRLIEFTETALFEKKKIISVLDDIDGYLYFLFLIQLSRSISRQL